MLLQKSTNTMETLIERDNMQITVGTEIDFFFRMIMVSLTILIIVTFIVLGVFIADWFKYKK